VIAVDAWLANDDRNLGNLVGSSPGNGRINRAKLKQERFGHEAN
jgi:hypothetical protein